MDSDSDLSSGSLISADKPVQSDVNEKSDSDQFEKVFEQVHAEKDSGNEKSSESKEKGSGSNREGNDQTHLEANVGPETKDDSIVHETKNDSIVPETKSDSIVPEAKDDSNVPETKDVSEANVGPEAKNDSESNVVPEAKDDSNVPEANVVPETKSDSIVPEAKDDSNVPEANVVPEAKDDSIVPEANTDSESKVVPEAKNSKPVLDQNNILVKKGKKAPKKSKFLFIESKPFTCEKSVSGQIITIAQMFQAELILLGFRCDIWGLDHELKILDPKTKSRSLPFWTKKKITPADWSFYDFIIVTEQESFSWLPNFQSMTSLTVMFFDCLHCTSWIKCRLLAMETDFSIHSTSAWISSFSEFVPRKCQVHLPLACCRYEFPETEAVHRFGYYGAVSTFSGLIKFLQERMQLHYEPSVGDRFLKLCSETDITLWHVSSAEVSLEMFQIVASGSVLCTNYLPELERLGFEDGTNCIMFDSIHDLANKLKCVTTGNALPLLKRGSRALVQKLSISKRAKELLTVLREFREKKESGQLGKMFTGVESDDEVEKKLSKLD